MPQPHNSLPAWIWLVPAGMLLAALLPLPGGLYMLLRIVVCGAAAFLAYQEFDQGNKVSGWVVCLGLIAILFNPIIPIHMSRDEWAIFDIGAVIALIVHWRRYSRLSRDEEQSVANT